MCYYAPSSCDSIVLTLQSSYFSSSEWAEDSTRCGHCDNCTRDPTSVVESDVTHEANRVLAITRLMHSRKIKVTAAQLAQAARGSGSHATLLQLAPGDRVTLSPHVRSSHALLRSRVESGMQDTEMLIANMLLERFLDKSYTSNAYKVQVYIKPGTLSRRLDEGQKLSIHLLLSERAARNNRLVKEGGGPGGKRKAAGKRPIKRMSNGASATVGDGSEEDEDADADADIVVDYSDEDGDEEGWIGRENAPESSSAKRRRRSSNQHQHQSSSWVPSAAALDVDFDVGGNQQEEVVPDSESERDGIEWKGNLRGAPAVTHRTLRNGLRSGSSAQGNAAVVSRPSGSSGMGANAFLDHSEIIDISSD